MGIFTKRTSFLALSVLVTLTVSGCATNGATEGYTIPGAALGNTVVDPPAELPAPGVPLATTDDVVNQKISCTPEALNAEAIEKLNYSNREATAPAFKGEFIVSAEQVPVTSNFQSSFSYLVKAELDSGKTVWFGTSDSLNDEEYRKRVALTANGTSPVFGATKATYELFSWGQQSTGINNVLVAHSEGLVSDYGSCF